MSGFDPGPAVAAAASDIKSIVLPADLAGLTAQTAVQPSGLKIPIGASPTEVWHFQWWLVFTSVNGTMDVKFTVDRPAGATGYHGVLSSAIGGFGAISTATAPPNLVALGTTLACGSVNGAFGLSVAALVMGGGNAGDVEFKYAQNTSDAGALTLIRPSLLIARKLVA